MNQTRIRTQAPLKFLLGALPTELSGTGILVGLIVRFLPS